MVDFTQDSEVEDLLFGASPGSEPGLFFSNNLLSLGSPGQLEHEVGVLSTMVDFPFCQCFYCSHNFLMKSCGRYSSGG